MPLERKHRASAKQALDATQGWLFCRGDRNAARDLEAYAKGGLAIVRHPAHVVVAGTPVDLTAFFAARQTVVRARYLEAFLAERGM